MKQSHLTVQVHAAFQQVWRQRSLRERKLLSLAGWFLISIALWQWALVPAWQTWHEAPIKQAQLDAQTQAMLQLQAQARALQTLPPITRSESVQWLEKHLTELGPNAKISVQAEQVTLSVAEVPATTLASWLGQARERALALPTQAQMQLTPSTDKPGMLRGTLILRLP